MRFDGDGTALRVTGSSVGRKQPAEEGQEAEQEEQGVIRPQSDLDGTALLITLIGLGPLVMRRQFARALGEERLTPAALMSISVPMLELFTHGLYADDTLLQATKAAIEEQEPQRRSTDNEN